MFKFASKGASAPLVVEMLENEFDVVELVLVMLELVL
jgi:hypothetical protein